MAQAVETTTPNFTGKWVLETTDNLDKFLSDSEGWGWANRKIAAAAWSHQNIEHDTEKGIFKIQMSNPKNTTSYTAVIGGEAVEYVDLTGLDTKVKLSWNEQKNVLMVNLQRYKQETDQERIAERWIDPEDQKMRNRITNPIKKISMVQIFKKAADKPEFS